MQDPSFKVGVFIGGVLAMPLIGLFYLGEVLASTPFVPFDLFDWLARNLPGSLITVTIDGIVELIEALNLGSTSEAAKTIEMLMALLLVIAAGALLGGVIGFASARGKNPVAIGAVIGLVLLFLVIMVENNLPTGSIDILEVAWLAVLLTGWGLLTGFLVSRVGQLDSEPRSQSRRSILAGIAGASFVVALSAWGLGSLFGSKSKTESASMLIDSVPTPINPPQTKEPVAAGSIPAEEQPTSSSAVTRDSFVPAPETRPELTPNDDFYRIDINTRPLSIEEDEWQLEIAGLFESPKFLTLDDIKSYPAVTQPITLSCISNRVGGDLIGTSNWTGVQLKVLLEDLGIATQAKEVMIDSADGFFESVTSADMIDPRTLLVYAMNGETLPKEHGFPLRIYVPNRYGMKQPKWITRLTAVQEPVLGYWVVRGWSQEARPQVVSVIDTIAEDDADSEGRIPIGGIAWAGDRGISKVEIQVDEGEWHEAELRLPPLSPLTWVQWRYDWTPEQGKHEFRVRATDGDGVPQIEKSSGVRPDGATGYHSADVRI